MNVIAVIGSRNFSDYPFFAEKLEHLLQNLSDYSFVSGGTKSGGDFLIKRYSKENNFKLVEHLPDWELHKKAAGVIRNKLIINDATHVIAFWDGTSRGTANSLKLAEKRNLPIKIVQI